MKSRKSKKRPYNPAATSERRRRELSSLPSSANAYLRLEEVAAMTSLSRITLWRLRDEKISAQMRFPQPVRLSAKRIAWLRADVENWMNKRAKSGYAAEVNLQSDPVRVVRLPKRGV